MIGNMRPMEIVLILLVILLLFGAKKLPDMARSLGKSARILKSEAKAMKKDSGDGGGDGDKDTGGGADAQRKTIQAAPGDVSSSRPVEEPAKQPNQN